MSKRSAYDTDSAVDTQHVRRRNPFAPIDGNPLPADCWYMIYNMLRNRDDRITLKLLNKSACTLFTQRCETICAEDVYYTPVPPRVYPPWLHMPRLKYLVLFLKRGATFEGYAQSAMTAVHRRTSGPITLKLHSHNHTGSDNRTRNIFRQRVAELFHSIKIREPWIVRDIVHGRFDFSGVTIYTTDTDRHFYFRDEGAIPSQFDDETRKPLAVRMKEILSRVRGPLDLLRQFFGDSKVFIGDSLTPFDPKQA